MKEKITAAGFLSLIILSIALGSGETDLVFVAATGAFFLLCFAYLEGCGKL